jgi:hypothetical protein
LTIRAASGNINTTTQDFVEEPSIRGTTREWFVVTRQREFQFHHGEQPALYKNNDIIAKEVRRGTSKSQLSLVNRLLDKEVNT